MISEEDWVRIYRESVRPLYAYVSRRTGASRVLAEDVTQEAYLRALRDWPRKGVPREPLAWLKTVARNLLSNYYRRRRPIALDGLEFDPAQPMLVPQSPEAAALLDWGLRRLPADQARLLEAFHLDGKSTAEMAKETGLSPRAVEGRLHRGRRKLADILRANRRSASTGGEP